MSENLADATAAAGGTGQLLQASPRRTDPGQLTGAGFSNWREEQRRMLSLAVVDADVVGGSEVRILWGVENGGSAGPQVERHLKMEIRATLAGVPAVAAHGCSVVRVTTRPPSSSTGERLPGRRRPTTPSRWTSGHPWGFSLTAVSMLGDVQSPPTRQPPPTLQLPPTRQPPPQVPSAPGIIFAVPGFLDDRACNIEESEQYRDQGSETFFVRVRFTPRPRWSRRWATPNAPTRSST